MHLRLFVYIATEPGKKIATARRIKAMNLGGVITAHANEMVVRIDDRVIKSGAGAERIMTRLEKTRGVLRAKLVPRYLDVEDARMEEALRTNRCWVFFDIDSTLTRGSPGTIHPEILSIFSKIAARGIKLFFASGRSLPDLIDLIKGYPVERYAIAENGGIIIGYGSDGYSEFGDKAEPEKVMDYIQAKYFTPDDGKQGVRHTEVIFLQKDVSKSRLCSAIRSTKAQVEVHASKNSYHISKKGINKGTAMLELCNRLHSGSRLLVAVGDSDMDIPMLKSAGYGFAVGNASVALKKAAKKTLKGRFEKGVEEIFRTADLI